MRNGQTLTAEGMVGNLGTATASDGHDNSMDILQIIRVMWRGKLVILTSALTMLIVGTYYAFAIAVPQFTAVTQMEIMVRGQQVLNIESVLSGTSTDQAAINTDIEIIKSRSLIERLVEDMHLVNDPEFNRYLRKPSLLSTEGIKSLLTSLASDEDSPTEDEILYSTTLAASEAIVVVPLNNTYLFDIRVTTTGREKSAALANRMAEIYLEDQITAKQSATNYAVGWLSERVRELEVEVRLKEEDITKLMSKTDLINAESLSALNVRAKETRDRLTDTRQALQSDQAELARYDQLVGNTNYITVARTLEDAVLSRLASGAVSGDREAKASFADRLDMLRQAVALRVDRGEYQIETLQLSYDQFERDLAQQNEDQRRLNQLEREVNASRVLYDNFLARLKEATVQQGLQQPDSRVLSEAIPGRQVKPRKAFLMAVSLVLGTAIGATVVMVSQFLYEGFRSTEELESSTGVMVLGQVPAIPLKQRKDLFDYLENNKVSSFVEAIRNFRTSLLLSSSTPPQVIMMTSSVPGEGKTTHSIALAQNFAGLGKRVLLVDGDIRRRSLEHYFKAQGSHGLVAAITGTHEVQDLVQYDPVLGIDVLLAEKVKANAADILSSERFALLLEELRSAYDFIVIDMPPVLAVPDARLASRHADAVLYMVAWNATAQKQVREGLRQLEGVGGQITGMVMTKVNGRRMQYYGYGDGAYVGY